MGLGWQRHVQSGRRSHQGPLAALARPAGPCAAEDYLVPVDRSGEAWIIQRSDIRPLAEARRLRFTSSRVVNPAETPSRADCSRVMASFDCKTRTYRFGTIVWLDDNFFLAAMRTPKPMGDPKAPPQGSDFALAVDAVCAEAGKARWLHLPEELQEPGQGQAGGDAKREVAAARQILDQSSATSLAARSEMGRQLWIIPVDRQPHRCVRSQVHITAEARPTPTSTATSSSFFFM